VDEKILLQAKNLQSISANNDEREIANIAIGIAKDLHLDEECILSCILVLPIYKTLIYISHQLK
jgi:hypothetical protein